MPEWIVERFEPAGFLLRHEDIVRCRDCAFCRDFPPRLGLHRARAGGVVRHRPERVLLAGEKEGGMTMGATYANDAPLPRSFECAMCGSDVAVTERRDHRMRFCCESCEKRFWKHADRYEGRKKTCSGHVTRLRRERDENRREAGL